jgi:hypothetical protein
MKECLKDEINDLTLNTEDKNNRDLYRGKMALRWATNREVT